MKRNIKKMALAAMLAGMLGGLTGCFIQPDPTLDPLQISDGTVPFGTVQALPTNTPTPVPQNTPTPTPDTWQSSDQSTWEDWSGGSLPTTTPKTAATVAPGAQSWQTSTQDYNAGYPVLHVGSTGSDVSDLQARLTELGYYTGTIDGKYSTGTQSAVTEFQSRNGLTADGIAGRATQDKLYSASAQPKTVSASVADSGYTLLKEGASGLDVRKLQGRLAELGYLRLDDDQRGQGLPAGERPERRRAGGQPDADEAVFRQREIRGQPGGDGEPGSDAHADGRHDGQRRLRLAGAAD